MNLLVTGGAGFIGAHLVQEALRHAEVARLVNLDCLTYAGDLGRLQAVEKDSRYVFEKVDLRDAAAVRRVMETHAISHVAHLAAETHVDRSIAEPRAFIDTNVGGTFHLLEACRAQWRGGEGRLVQVSTDEVYGSLAQDEPAFTEESPLRPNSPYAASKAAADCLARSYLQTYALPVVITRASNNYGPRQHEEKLIPTVLRCLRQGQPIPIYGDGNYTRDWLHVKDHAEALWQVLMRGQAGEVYNIGGGNEWTNLDLIGLLCDLHDEHTGQAAGASRALWEHIVDRPGHDRRYAVDSGKMRRELGWKPGREFSEGIRELVRQYVPNQMEG
jgi:dTDP-glucose 4,6-dehydratase